jgi:hypothetical protein
VQIFAEKRNNYSHRNLLKRAFISAGNFFAFPFAAIQNFLLDRLGRPVATAKGW